MWNLDQQAGAVTALAVGVEPTPMRKSRQRRHTEDDSAMTQAGRGDEAHAAGSSCVGQVPRPGAT